MTVVFPGLQCDITLVISSIGSEGLLGKRLFTKGDWTMRYYPPANKCKLDSPWLGPYLVVLIAGWAIGVQLQPDSP